MVLPLAPFMEGDGERGYYLAVGQLTIQGAVELPTCLKAWNDMIQFAGSYIGLLLASTS